MRRSTLLLPLCLLVATLAGCGNKGPLVPAPVKPGSAKPAAASSAIRAAAPVLPDSSGMPVGI